MQGLLLLFDVRPRLGRSRTHVRASMQERGAAVPGTYEPAPIDHVALLLHIRHRQKPQLHLYMEGYFMAANHSQQRPERMRRAREQRPLRLLSLGRRASSSCGVSF